MFVGAELAVVVVGALETVEWARLTCFGLESHINQVVAVSAGNTVGTVVTLDAII